MYRSLNFKMLHASIPVTLNHDGIWKLNFGLAQ
jgi:hypothetical protein